MRTAQCHAMIIITDHMSLSNCNQWCMHVQLQDSIYVMHMQTHLGHATDLVVVRLFGSRFGSVYARALQVGTLHTQWLTVT